MLPDPRRSLVALALAGGIIVPAAVGAEELNSIVLRVNDEIATLHDYRERKEARLAAVAELDELAPEVRQRYLAEAPRATMREILDELLLLSRARQLVIEPSRSEIDEAIDSTRQRMGLPNEAAFENALRAANMTFDDYRDRTTRSLKTSQVIQREVHPKVEIEDEWIQRYFREHPDEFRVPARIRVRELVLPGDQVSGEAARDLAAAIRAALAGGEGMAEAAARLGADRIVGPVELGWVEPGELAPALDAAVWALPPGGLSPPIDARGGLHLVEVLERAESSIKPYSEVKAEIESNERNRRYDDVLKKFLGDLEKSAFLAENIPAEAAGFRDVNAAEESDPLAVFAPRREERPAPPPPIEPISPPLR